MSHYEFGNFNRENDYSLYQVGRSKKAIADAQAAKKQEQAKVKEQAYEQKTVDANSLEALGAYGMAFSGLNKKSDVSALGISAHDQLTVGKYVNAEQQARIEEDFLKYFG